MEKVQDIPDPKDPYVLTTTGQAYDGIDEEFDGIIRNIDGFNYSLRLQPIHFSASHSNVFLNPGEALFHVTSLASGFLRIFKFPNVTEKDFKKVEVLIPYIIKWMHCQIDKLMSFDESDKVDVKSNDCSEFHLSQHLFDKSKDSLVTSFALEYIQQVLSEITVHNPDYEHLYEYASTFSRLEKLLRKSYLSKNRSALKKKHMPNHFNLLNSIKFDTLVSRLTSLMQQKNYMLAEAFANKSLMSGKKLSKDDHVSMICLVSAKQAYIGCQLNDIDLCLHGIDQILKVLAQEKQKEKKLLTLLIQQTSSYFSNACAYAGDYFEKNNEIDTAIKYYLEAIKFTTNKADISKYHQKLNELEISLVSLIEKEIKDEFNAILNAIKSYPRNKTLIIYFKSSEDAQQIRKILDNKMQHFCLSETKTEDERNAIAFKLDYQFKVHVLKKAFAILKKQKIQEQAKNLQSVKSKKNPSEEPKPSDTNNDKDIGFNLSHPKASSNKSKPKKPPKREEEQIPVTNWPFLELRRPKALERVEFEKTKKVFDPFSAQGVVPLRVNGLSGRWFACMNPRIIEEIEKIKKGEGIKLLAKFNSDTELINDLCVPCYKEMRVKEAELGVKLPYVFKIRLLGGDGLGNVRIYATIIDQTPDGKKLVAFTAINPNSHAKHTRPIHFDMPDMPENPEEMAMLTNLNN